MYTKLDIYEDLVFFITLLPFSNQIPEIYPINFNIKCMTKDHKENTSVVNYKQEIYFF